MKIQSLLALVLLAGSMSGAELWKFAPETVKPDKNTLISPAGEGFKSVPMPGFTAQVLLPSTPHSNIKYHF